MSDNVFTGSPKVEYDANASKILGKDYWRVTESFNYLFWSKGKKYRVHVPRGYLTDGASVPRVFWSLIPPWGPYGPAAIVHDFLCDSLLVLKDDWTELEPGEAGSMRITRKIADNIFLQAMKDLKVSSAYYRTMFWAVSLYRVVTRPKTPAYSRRKVMLETDYRFNVK